MFIESLVEHLEEIQNSVDSHDLVTLYFRSLVPKCVLNHVVTFTPGSDDRSGVAGEERLCLCGILPMDHNERDMIQILNIPEDLLEDLGSVTTARLERSRFGSESRTQIKCHEPVHRRALPRPNRSAFL